MLQKQLRRGRYGTTKTKTMTCLIRLLWRISYSFATLYFLVNFFFFRKRPTTTIHVCNHGGSRDKGSQTKTQCSSFLFQLWIIALVIPAEITDRVLICRMVTSAIAVQIIWD